MFSSVFEPSGIAFFLKGIRATKFSLPKTSSITVLMRCTFSSDICINNEPEGVNSSRDKTHLSLKYDKYESLGYRTLMEIFNENGFTKSLKKSIVC